MDDPEPIIVRFRLCPGDEVVMTGTIRDLFRANPGRFRVGVSSPVPEIWQNNPFISGHAHHRQIPKGLVKPRIVDLNWGIHGTNDGRMHFIECFSRGMSESLGVQIPLTEPNGDLHLSAAEYSRDVAGIVGTDKPYILIAPSFKTDCRTKAWPGEYWQAVVDGIKDRIAIVQVGHAPTISPTDGAWLTDKGGRHYAWPLSGVINRVGKTGVRDLMLAVRGASAVVGGITFVQHLAAALRKPDGSRIPHITIAGGRESQFVTQGHANHVLHTIGSMDCCKNGGCWKSHLDGSTPNQNSASPQCLHPVTMGNNRFAGCMLRIRPPQVISTIESLLG